MDAPNTLLHDRSLSGLDTGTSTKNDGNKPVLWVQTFSPRDMIRSHKCLAQVN
jgi:hypothetical protein